MTKSPSVDRQSLDRRRARAGGVIIALGIVALSAVAFLPQDYNGRSTSALLTLVLLTLCVAIALHVRFLLRARLAHGDTVRVLEAAEREFESVFDSVPDAIVILGDQGICLEANPAALALFGTMRQDLIGHAIQKFYSPAHSSENALDPFLGRDSGHGEIEIARRSGETLVVEYTVKANYLPGRHVAILRDISLRREAERALSESDERFRQMADNIQEVYWMVDAETKHVISINPAYETVTGRSLETLRANPISYQELFHPEDRVRVLTRLEEAGETGHIDEEFRIIRPDRTVRWVLVHGFPVRDAAGVVRRLVGTAQDITARKSAEEQMARNLALAESASAEADAFRKTTLALTQNLSMDYVLDTLLQSLLKLIPCESARVLLVETDTHLFLAREMHRPESTRRLAKCPPTCDARDNRFLMQVLTTRAAVLLPDTSTEHQWQAFKGYAQMRSWLCIPLVASQRVLGLLSLGATRPQAFSPDHLRLAKSLAIPAAVAIQNARLYERAEIYSAELEQRLADLEQTQNALRHAEQGRVLSEEKFSRVFRSSPIAFSITTVHEGRFLDVNEAFERRYGYARGEVLGRTVFDIGIWDDPNERGRMLEEIRQHGRVRNRITRFRKRSGEAIDTIYSADIMATEGCDCVLAVSEDLPEHAEFGAPLARKAALLP
ncbi:MAG: PAS domain S-box protein [Candidatus Acidiferrales bacterium]